MHILVEAFILDASTSFSNKKVNNLLFKLNEKPNFYNCY